MRVVGRQGRGTTFGFAWPKLVAASRRASTILSRRSTGEGESTRCCDPSALRLRDHLFRYEHLPRLDVFTGQETGNRQPATGNERAVMRRAAHLADCTPAKR